MAIIACKECTREVSDKAARCPHCGVSIAEPIRRPPRRVKPWLYGVLIVVLLAWAALTTLSLTGIIPEPKQLAGFIGAGSGPVRTFKASAKTAEQVSPIAGARATLELGPVNSAVYVTSLEQLYQDYDANEVAIRSKIGDKPIRVSGAVAEISEDTSGQPVVTLHSGSNGRADMVLSDDQRSAAAQLSKEDAVEIQCNKLQRIEARLHGSGCALVLIDSGANPVYLAVSMSSKAGNAPLYIVGPISRKTCLASSDTIAAQVNSNPKNDRVLSKSCAATARESVSLEDCHLSSTMSAIPDLPTAHLWKYDCMAPAVETRKAARTAASRGTPNRAAAPEATWEIAPPPEPASAPAPAVTEEIATLPTPVSASAPAVTEKFVTLPTPVSASAPAVTEEIASLPTPASASAPAVTKEIATLPTPASASAPAVTKDIATLQTPASESALSEPVAPASKLDNGLGSAGAAAPATVNAGEAGGSQQPTTAAVSNSTATAPTPSTTVADDLVPVRTKDPAAADRIVSYCSKITSNATNPTMVAARCRQDEMDAWTRLVIQNEFPTLDDSSRRKCNEPPFPDSFVARESCAKYQLRVD